MARSNQELFRPIFQVDDLLTRQKHPTMLQSTRQTSIYIRLLNFCRTDCDHSFIHCDVSLIYKKAPYGLQTYSNTVSLLFTPIVGYSSPGTSRTRKIEIMWKRLLFLQRGIVAGMLLLGRGSRRHALTARAGPQENNCEFR